MRKWGNNIRIYSFQKNDVVNESEKDLQSKTPT
jgi:hypothetical protein